MKIEDAVIVITGAGSGIGLATALRFAKKHARLHLVDLKQETAEAAAAQCAKLGSRASFYAADVRDAKALADVAEQVVARDARVDVWHNNAGVAFAGRVQDMTLDDWRWVLDTNLYGVINGVHAVLPTMIKQRAGHIINTASVLGQFALPTASAYCASKSAVIAMSEVLCAELAGQGITVTAVCPGLIATRIVADGKMTNMKLSRGMYEKTWAKMGVPPDRVARDIERIVKRRQGGVIRSAATLQVLSWLRTFAPTVYRLSLRGIAYRA